MQRSPGKKYITVDLHNSFFRTTFFFICIVQIIIRQKNWVGIVNYVNELEIPFDFR